MKKCLIPLICAITSLSSTAHPGEVTIKHATVKQANGGNWHISVTLEHGDTGWDHYADEWRVLDENGKVLGTRRLAHPHVNEQPFTRSLSNIAIPANTKTIWIDARDSVHGRNPVQFRLDLP